MYFKKGKRYGDFFSRERGETGLGFPGFEQRHDVRAVVVAPSERIAHSRQRGALPGPDESSRPGVERVVKLGENAFELAPHLNVVGRVFVSSWAPSGRRPAPQPLLEMVHDQLLDLARNRLRLVQRHAQELPRQVVHVSGQVGRRRTESPRLLLTSPSRAWPPSRRLSSSPGPPRRAAAETT